MYLGAGAVGGRWQSADEQYAGTRAAGQYAAGGSRRPGGNWRPRGMGFSDRHTAAVGGRGSRPPGQYAAGRQLADGQLTAGGSSSSVYRGYYCICEADGAVVPAEIVLSTALGKL